MNKLRLLLESPLMQRNEAISVFGSRPEVGGIEGLLEKFLPFRSPANELIDDEYRHELSREDAAVWLCLLATHSLCHGVPVKRSADVLPDVELGLSTLPNGRFFSVGKWQFSRRGREWERVRAVSPWKGTRLHFSGPYIVDETDQGVFGAVMGFDDASAFMFAVVEDD